MVITRNQVLAHFTERATMYDRSSSWCEDPALGARIVRAMAARPSDHVLDIACGTGLVSKLVSKKVARLVGVDFNPVMANKARPFLDEFIEAPAEHLPFPDGTFDIAVCRQGIQFMDLPQAVEEMVRVVRPGGRVVLANLTAYGEEDADEFFRVLALRNPVRRHFFLPDDLPSLLRSAGCAPVAHSRYVTAENITIWSDNGAIGAERREAIVDFYRNTSPVFRALHHVEERDGYFHDSMLFIIAVGQIPPV